MKKEDLSKVARKQDEVIAATNVIRLPYKKEIQINSYYVDYATKIVGKFETQLETYVSLKDFKNNWAEELRQYNRIDESRPMALCKEIHQEIANQIVEDLKNEKLKIEGVQIKED